jgi:hypothetical protein
MGKQLVKLITCGYESSTPFLYFTNRARTHSVLGIGLYEWLGNPTTQLNEPPGSSHLLDNSPNITIGHFRREWNVRNHF